MRGLSRQRRPRRDGGLSDGPDRADRLLAAFGRDARCITKFYDDRFVVENLTTGKEASIPYARIRKVAEDERYVFLLLDTRIISPVDKSDFINGSAEDFAEFIKAKAVNTVRRRADKPERTLEDR